MTQAIARATTANGAETNGQASSTYIIDGHVFDKAQNDVQKLMERDGFIRFKQSPLFSDFMKEVRGAQRSRTIPHDSLQTCTRLARARTAESKLGLVVADNSAGTGRGRSTMRRPGGRG